MDVNTFLHIDNLQGDSQDSQHKGDIEVLSWSWGATQQVTLSANTLGGSGKPSIQDIQVTKKVDSSSPTIFKMCCAGSQMKTGALTVRQDGVDYLVIQFEQLILTSYNVSVGSGGQITENVSFTFARCGMTFKSNKGITQSRGGWDRQTNKEFDPK